MLNIYKNALKYGCYLEATCVSTSRHEWDELMRGAVKGNKKIITKIAVLAGVISKDEAKYWNPYMHKRTKTHIVYIHSGIEYFIKPSN